MHLLRPSPSVEAPADRSPARRLPSARFLVPLVFLGTLSPLAGATAPAAAEIRFNRDVLPILSEHCYACHGPDNAGRKGGLRLDQREHALADADSGAPAILPGQAEESELMLRITAEDPEDLMPRPDKGGKRLSPEEVDILRRWIDAGAPYEQHWAFIPPERSAPPAVGNLHHPVDQFVRARLLAEGIEPSPEASRATLVRRLSLDLTGLPPSPAEVAAFVADSRPDAYTQLVDRLLGSVHFGEKWARWWLDLAHYGDSDGIRLDSPRPFAWRYRQWVVDAFNADMPFDRFTIEQLAGDLLPGATPEQRLGTGFLRNTISDRQTGNADPELGRVRQIVDRTATMGTTWLGLSVACAECHDHKFDPISQREFFQLYSFFNDAEEANIDLPLPGEWEPYYAARLEYEARRAELLAPLAEPLAALQAAWEEKMLWAQQNPGEDPFLTRAFELLVTQWGRGQGEGQFEGLMIIKTPVAIRTQDQKERLQDYFLRRGQVVDPERFKELKIADLAKQLDALAKKVPPLSRAQTMAPHPAPNPARIHLRGDFRRPGEAVTHGTPAALPALKVEGPATRLDLARWLVSPDHPLTTRVTVNRLWQELFGRGIVASSDNFGLRGEHPSHPELLDWLATEFAERGWSIKSMLRLLVTSQTYRQSSYARPDLETRDPYNALLARQVRLRLSAEGVRDNALAASGLLNRAVGGPSVRPPQPESVTKENTRNPWVADTGEAIYRRGLYTFIQRLSPFAQFVNFDLPGTAHACALRERSNTPLQALNLLNDPLFVEAAQALARRIWRESPGDAAQRLEFAFQTTLARAPSANEVLLLTRYLAQQTERFEQDATAATSLVAETLPGASPAESAAWVLLASVLLNLDEFINRE